MSRTSTHGKIERFITHECTCFPGGAIFHEADKPQRRGGTCGRCGGVLEKRADDDPDTIRRRLAVFCADVEPVILHYRRSDRPAGD